MLMTINQYWQNPNFRLFSVIAVLFLITFAIGTARNKRLQQVYFTYLHHALEPFSKKLRVGKVGSSGYVVVAKLAPPWYEIELTILLQPRDIALFWLANIFWGRGDRFIIRANRVQSPGYNLAFTAKGQQPASLVSKKPWLRVGEIEGYTLYVTEEKEKAFADRWRPFLNVVHSSLWQLVVQQQKEHIRALLWANKLPLEKWQDLISALLLETPKEG